MRPQIPKTALYSALAALMVSACAASAVAQPSVTLWLDKQVVGDTLVVDVKIKETGMTISGGGTDILFSATIDVQYDPNFVVYPYHGTTVGDLAVYESFPREESPTGATYGLQVATPTLSLTTNPTRVPNPSSGSAGDVCNPPNASCFYPYNPNVQWPFIRASIWDLSFSNPLLMTTDTYVSVIRHKLLILPPSGATVQKTAFVNPIDVTVDSASLAIFFVDDLGLKSAQGCTGHGSLPNGSAVAGYCIIDNPVLLPVELSDFSAVVDNGNVILNWSTTSETNNLGFSVEDAIGDGPFQEVAFVDGAGTSLEQHTYTYTVKGLDIGHHRFRLKQLDYDGATKYSQIVETTIELAGTHRLSPAYPNPFNSSTTFELVVGRDQRVKIDIINALGQRVQRLLDGSLEANKPTNFTFNAAMLPTGLYFYRVIGENFAQTRQVLLVK